MILPTSARVPRPGPGLVQAVVVATDEGERHQHPDSPDRADEPTPERIEMEVLLQEQVAEHRAR